jgi:UDP-GlcNAc:undecaprenyl-phosphate GlcNAc-1-phosphate transferase
MNEGISYLVTLCLALGVTLLLIPVMDRLGRRWNIVSRYGGRRLSESDARRVSKLGGAALFGGFMTAVIAAQMLPVPRADAYEWIRLVGLIGGGTVIFVVGLLDDVFDLPPLQQFMGQFAAAAIAIAFQIFIEFFNNPLTGQQTDPWSYWVTVTISFFWLVGMMNTVNWLDGADGLAGGVAVIAGAILFINSAFRVEPAQASVSLLHLALVGSALGFVIHNFHPARIIMGGGAPFLGYVLGCLAIIGGAKMATILLVMGLPLLDSVWQVVNRLRRGKNPFVGDRGHLHFRLQDMGVSTRQMVLGYYVFCAFFGGLTLVTDSQVFKFIALGVMALTTLAGFVVIGRRYYARSAVESPGGVTGASASAASSKPDSSTF